MQGMTAGMTQSSPMAPGQNGFAGTPLFDPSDPALFNFDLASLNFGNHYGALEFGMLGHMSSGAADSPRGDHHNSISQAGGVAAGFAASNAGSYSDSPNSAAPQYNQDYDPKDWHQPSGNRSRHGSLGNIYGTNGNTRHERPHRDPQAPHTYTITAQNIPSPSPPAGSPQQLLGPFEPQGSGFYAANKTRQNNNGTKLQAPRAPLPSVLGKRHRDSSSIYESIKQPYNYTNGFHSLASYFQRRFSPQKTLKIARSLASIRPSFMSCTKTLNRDDLIFMEKCFQRTLWEYEDFINACGTPTIVCRRTGEIAAVGKEFSILTGWTKDVLLGKAENKNVNIGSTSSSTPGSGRAGLNTPRMNANVHPDDVSRPQPVLLAELLDDDSVVEFYEDFAKLAFGDSRGSITTRCKLLRYKTKDDMDREAAIELAAEEQGQKGVQIAKIEPGTDNTVSMVDGNATGSPQQRKKKLKGGIAKEEEMGGLSGTEGKVECTYCWTVKRDVFDIPMLIVMNVSSPHLALLG
jgi:hypothetical protein